MYVGRDVLEAELLQRVSHVRECEDERGTKKEITDFRQVGPTPLLSSIRP